MSKRAEQKALEEYPTSQGTTPPDRPWSGRPWQDSDMNLLREPFIKGYELAKKDFVTLVKDYIEIGERCMEQEGESQIYAFWDGFHNCAENILRELEDEK